MSGSTFLGRSLGIVRPGLAAARAHTPSMSRAVFFYTRELF